MLSIDGGGDYLSSDRFEAHTEEEHNEDGDDCDGDKTSCDGGVVCIGIVAEKCRGWEEVNCFKKGF
jgi:hypothetical protein